ncbi:hypothetical protein GQ457_03G014290 [Hibiscus cannabinus]
MPTHSVNYSGTVSASLATVGAVEERPPERNRGRPPSSRKGQIDTLGGVSGVRFTLHVMTVNVGEMNKLILISVLGKIISWDGPTTCPWDHPIRIFHLIIFQVLAGNKYNTIFFAHGHQKKTREFWVQIRLFSEQFRNMDD